MRSLAQPEVLRSAAIAACISALLSLPRLLLWTTRKFPIWYLEAVLLLGGTVLWAFVFAWHTKYTQRPVLTRKVEGLPFILATGAGLLLSTLMHFFFDPHMRARTPEEYPSNFAQWFAMLSFSLAFTQLFLIFAPFAWLIRLVHQPKVATVMTALFGMVVLWLKNQGAKEPLSTTLLLSVLAARGVASLFSVYLFLRGGVLLVWWWEFLIQSRHLLDLHQPQS